MQSVSAIIIGAMLIGAWSIVRAQTTISAPTCTLAANPSSIKSGESSTLTWSSTRADTAVFDQGIGTTSSPGAGSIVVLPNVTTLYSAVFSGAGGTTTCSMAIEVTDTATASTPSINPAPLNVPTTTTLPVVTPAMYPVEGSTPAPMVVDVDAKGGILIRGTVIYAGNDALTINSWGGMWIIRTAPSTTVIGNVPNTSGSLSGFKTGDFVGVQGVVAQNQVYTVDASLIRNWTTTPYTGAPAAGTLPSGSGETPAPNE